MIKNAIKTHPGYRGFKIRSTESVNKAKCIIIVLLEAYSKLWKLKKTFTCFKFQVILEIFEKLAPLSNIQK